MLILLVNESKRCLIKMLPPETMIEIFDYLRFKPTNNGVGYKIDLYNSALVCRGFSQYAIPLLWRDFIFYLDDEINSDNPYQKRFFEMLTLESSRNFIYTKRLHLYLSIESVAITETSQCSAIYSKLKKLLNVYTHAAPSLQTLVLDVEPFIPTDVVHDGLWPILNCCNDSIYNFLGQLKYRETGLRHLNLTLGRSVWRYEETFQSHVEQVLWMLGSMITTLDITEHPGFIAPWLPTMPRLQVLEFHNVDPADELGSISFWKAIAPLNISRAQLTGFNLPKNLCQYISRTVTRIALNQVNDIVTACEVCYTQLSQLEVCCLNSGAVKSFEAARSTVIKETVCRRLVQICFLESFAPVGIVSTIAKSNPLLAFCGAPINISDNDVYNLGKHCKRLRVLDMSRGKIDKITPHIQLTKAGLAPLPQMRRLNRLSLHHRHACLLDKPIIVALASCNRLMRQFEISLPPLPRGQSTEDMESVIKGAVSGSSEFHEWLVRFVENNDPEGRGWRIRLSEIRETLRKMP